MDKPFLLLQSRPENRASDDEYVAFLRFGGLQPQQLERVRLDRGDYPTMGLKQYAGVIMSGGPANFAYDDAEKSVEQQQLEQRILPLMHQIIAEDKPFLGACLGVGAVVTAMGGRMSFDYSESVGAIDIRLTQAAQTDPLLSGFSVKFRGFVGHKEGIKDPPAGCVVLAQSDVCIQLLRVGQNVYATQFHPELDAAGLALRIDVYKHAGYFAPEEAQLLIDAANCESIIEPVKLLRRFVKRYSI